MAEATFKTVKPQRGRCLACKRWSICECCGVCDLCGATVEFCVCGLPLAFPERHRDCKEEDGDDG